MPQPPDPPWAADTWDADAWAADTWGPADAAIVSSATRYRYGYRLNWQHALMLWIWGWYAARG